MAVQIWRVTATGKQLNAAVFPDRGLSFFELVDVMSTDELLFAWGRRMPPGSVTAFRHAVTEIVRDARQFMPDRK